MARLPPRTTSTRPLLSDETDLRGPITGFCLLGPVENAKGCLQPRPPTTISRRLAVITVSSRMRPCVSDVLAHTS
jgi:hypothetical protein